MKKIMIFGAGQAGKMVKKWLGVDYELLGFIDNNYKQWGHRVDNLPIYEPKVALSFRPDIIWITVLNYEACEEISKQLKGSGFKGEIYNISDIRDLIDIRLATARLFANEVKERNIPGEVAELGVYKGAFALEINKLFPNKHLYLFDTFEGFKMEDIKIEKENNYSKAEVGDFSDTTIEYVRNRLSNPEKVTFIKGYFPDSINIELPKFSFVSLDTDLYESTYQGLKVFYPRLVKGGIIIIHDYNSKQFPGVKEAVRRFCNEEDVYIIPICDMHGSAIILGK